MKIEFNIGQSVTFSPFGRNLKATVRGIKCHRDQWGNDDDRVFYRLSGRDGDAVNSVTTGKSIRESRYYEPWTPQKEATFFKT